LEYLHTDNRIELREGDRVLAEIDFPATGPDSVSIAHTWVDGSLRGQGIAGKLVQMAADRLREAGKKATPDCSYAASWFANRPDYADVLKQGGPDGF